MSKAKTETISLVDLLAKCSESDLASIDEQIAAKQAELDEATKQIGGELEALRQLRKVVDVKLHGKQKRAWGGGKRKKKDQPEAAPASPPASGGRSEFIERIAKVLRDCGGCNTFTIARKLGDEKLEHSVRLTLGHNKDKFMRNDDGTWETVD